MMLINLKELYLNDTFLEYLPGSFGRLSNLRVLEVRENRLKTLPKSMSRLTDLERLDIGTNEFDMFVITVLNVLLKLEIFIWVLIKLEKTIFTRVLAVLFVFSKFSESE